MSWANLSNANLSDANFDRASLIGANLSCANLEGAAFGRVNFNQANLRRANLRGISGANSFVLLEDETRVFNQELVSFGVNFAGADLSEANLNEASLRGTNFQEANLSLTKLLGTDFSQADLSGANLSGADLNKTLLVGTNFINADFSEVVVRDAIFANVDLSKIEGLDTVRHMGPSIINIETIYFSIGNNSCKGFLEKAGVPSHLIDYIEKTKIPTECLYTPEKISDWINEAKELLEIYEKSILIVKERMALRGAFKEVQDIHELEYYEEMIREIKFKISEYKQHQQNGCPVCAGKAATNRLKDI